jgi:hypothetical protein
MTGAVTTADDGAIFAGGLGSVKMVARDGDVVPGTGGAAINVVTISNSSYSENHGTLFGCTLTGGGVTTTTDSALVVATPTGKTLIAREGSPAPGLTGFVFGIPTGTYNFGSSTNHRINDRGQVLFTKLVTDGSAQPLALYSWDPLHGLQLQLVGGDSMGGGIVASITAPQQFPSGDGSTLGFTENGDFCIRATIQAVGGQFIARGHVGSLNGTPSAVPVAGGVPHNMTLDVTPAYGNQFYFILATGLGTDVGFPHPLNFAINVPIDYDSVWTSVSQAWVNSVLWTNTLWVTDAAGKGPLPISFNMPAGYPGFLGTTLKHSALLFDGALVGTYATEPTTCYLY